MMIKISVELQREMIEQLEAMAMEIDLSAIDLSKIAAQVHDNQLAITDASLLYDLSKEQPKIKRMVAASVRKKNSGK